MPDHLTEAQLAYFTEQTRRAVKAATRRQRNSARIGFLILFLGTSYAIIDGRNQAAEGREAIVTSARNVATDSCNARYKQQIVLRQIVRNGRPAIKKYVAQGTLTPEQGAEALKENTKTINSLALPDCRLVAKLITDDLVNLKKNFPRPLYPGSPDAKRLPQPGARTPSTFRSPERRP